MRVGVWYATGVQIPQWLTLGFAAVVIAWGAYRIRLGLKPKNPDPDAPARGGLARMTPRMHLFVGAIYLVLGAALLATSFGWNPLGNMIGPDTKVPAKDQAPTTGGVPIDTVPTPKK